MDDPVFKQKYQKYKLRVKLWEKDFRKKHGRIPSKYDIREASKEIRDSYKMYYKLKTSFLEDTLNDVLAEDGFDVLEASQIDGVDISFDDSFCESVNGGPKLPLDISAITTAVGDNSSEFSNLNDLPNGMASLSNIANLHGKHVIKEFEPVEQLPLNKHAWGSNVSQQPTVEQQKKALDNISKPFKTNLNQKLFKAASFSKRNPRKSLSRTALDSTSVRGSQSNPSARGLEQELEVLPDLETILTQKAKEQQALANSHQVSDKLNKAIKTHIDEGWLRRNTASNGIKVDTQPVDKDTAVVAGTPGRKQTFGLSNIDVSKILIPPTFSATEQLVAESTVLESVPIMTVTSPVPQKTLTAAKLPAQKIKKQRVRKESSTSSDSDAVVSNSEDEQEAQQYRHLVKRRRTLTKNESQLDSQSFVSNESVLQEKQLNNAAQKPLTPAVEADADDYELGKDFSADENDDEDYVKEKPKGRSKKITAKRGKPIQKDPLPKVAKKKQPKQEKSNKKPPTRKSARGGNKKDKPAAELKNDELEEEKPLDPEDLKYALALESGDITAVPRINLDDLETVDNVAQRYINTLPVIATNSPRVVAGAPVNEKRVAARKKLQEKIDSGKLNENFVTINIQKKTFVRGKKSINYSKYKKKLWKNQKRVNALSGPDMNMGGCDGGVLTCFTCGQVGHFAQNCKLKGDALLPLTAQLEEDPSPFPTLEEAEQMASQSAVAVHSRNIARLPAAANAAIYRNDVETDENSSDGDDTTTLLQKNGGNIDANEDKEIFMETDDELEVMDLNAAELDATQQLSPIKKYIGHKIPEEFLRQAGLQSNNNVTRSQQYSGVGSLYDLNPDGTVQAVTPEVLEVLHMFGHTDFRKGQDRAVMRILSGLSTLVTLSTGSGKSLCYQLPAYMYSRKMKSITLVISPLVSLMEDQVTGVPHFLRAHCLHTNQTPQQRLKTMQLISDGEVDILLVSPEAVVAGERSTGFGSILRQLPPIAFACIDEAHCVSQWSHNFRPSYLMICKVLRQNLGVKTVLGLTATATLPTRLSIIRHLGIFDGECGIISDIPLPDNLILSISKDENRDAALLQILKSERFDVCQSIIIYCTRRDECERIAGFIRTCMQDRKVPETDGKKKRKRINWHAEPYHAGMPSSRRRTIQNAFMKNELRIVVATVAFGMGINKPDIRSVIHYNMPRNFESYVQEIGRAGRDGKLAHCHLFLDAKGGDQNELRRHIYANSIDRHVIRKLLQRIFVSCSCDTNLKKNDYSKIQLKATDNETVHALATEASDLDVDSTSLAKLPVKRQHICPGHEIGFSIEKTVEALDIPAENISTLLCYMELDTRWNMNVLSSAYINAKVISYGGPKYLKHAAKECPPLAMAIALEIKKKTFKDDSNIIEFCVVDIAAAIGWNSGVVKYQLKNLEWVQVNGYPKRSPITITFNDLGFRIKAPGDFTSDEIDDALDTLYNRSVKQEKTQLIQLQYVFQGLSSVAYNTCAPCGKEKFPHDRSDQLKAIIRDYFRNDYPKDLKLEIDATTVPDDCIISDVRAMLNMYPDNNFSGRNLARIFHGISSPNYPAIMWGRCKYWRAHCKTDFNRIVQLANEVIVKMRT